MSILKKDGAKPVRSPFESVRQAAKNPLVRPRGELWMVLDRSGSMRGEPMAELRQAAKQVITDWSSKVQIEIVAFNDKAQRMIPSDIEGMYASGGTSFMAGLGHLMTSKPGSQAILMSDGQPHEPRERILGCVRDMNGQVVINTVACGNNADEELLSEIARLTGGVFRKANEPIDLPVTFKEIASRAVGMLTAGETK